MTNAVSLSHSRTAAERALHGNMCFGRCIFAIDATPADVQTGAAVDYSINGQTYTLAIDAAIDISAEITGTFTVADLYETIFVFCVDAAGAYTVVAGDAVLTSAIDDGTKLNHWPEDMGADVAAFAAVKVKNATGSLFTLGTTDLDTASITDTYYNLSIVPANIPV